MSRTTSHHLYIHVPFCRLVCAYCDFVTVGGRAPDIPRYVAALRRELGLREAPGELETLYFGGGTPSLLDPAAIDQLVRTAADRWGRRPSEITLEANPSAREGPDWRGLRAAGINRLSLGVQSLRDADLTSLARGHTAAEARAAYAAARKAGFDNVSIDLIYGIPGQSVAGWRHGLRAVIALEPDHISLYALQLALEPDEWAAPPRRGALRWRRRMARRLDDDMAASQYEIAEEELDLAGYVHYELSSWARPGRQSRHNSAYWARRPYTGIGCGAHSFDGTERSWNVRDLDRYLARVDGGERPIEDSERLDQATGAFEAVALGLRRVSGLSRSEFQAEFGVDPVARFARSVRQSVRNGWLELDGDQIRFTPRGRLLASEVLVAFLPDVRELRAEVSIPALAPA